MDRTDASVPRERLLDWQPTCPNPLAHRDDYSGLALRHGTLNSRFQAASYLARTEEEHELPAHAFSIDGIRDVKTWGAVISLGGDVGGAQEKLS